MRRGMLIFGSLNGSFAGRCCCCCCKSANTILFFAFPAHCIVSQLDKYSQNLAQPNAAAVHNNRHKSEFQASRASLDRLADETMNQTNVITGTNQQ